MCPRTTADRDRLADVQRSTRAVAEQIDPGVARQLAELELRQRRDAGRAALRRRAATAAARRQQRGRLGDRGGVRAQAGEQRAEHASAGLGIRECAVGGLHLDTERIGDGHELALALERQQRPRQGRGAQNRRVGPLGPDALERLAQHPAVERGVVGHHHPPA
jgi:hypothetical protein